MNDFFWNTLASVSAVVIVSISKSLFKNIKAFDAYQSLIASFLSGIIIGASLLVYSVFAEIPLWVKVYECVCAFGCFFIVSMSFVKFVKNVKAMEKHIDQIISERAKHIQ